MISPYIQTEPFEVDKTLISGIFKDFSTTMRRKPEDHFTMILKDSELDRYTSDSDVDMMRVYDTYTHICLNLAIGSVELD